ncbi:hypothetical protein BWI97_04060 [Siphonobacter sp. BAB-5405]|uniref:M4 family metallopeptidase n=1 Tax=Siphonobacter sp. BAB-5405 TaxID=1864825 RepID=UPI000C80AE28|nr:M4 family metallopeptidase [Siphonobacter sp. BAB-5405]PMD98342.1 hypothetical protein BWI97_04060 [Siphonobacter sp. BAB-5405]
MKHVLLLFFLIFFHATTFAQRVAKETIQAFTSQTGSFVSISPVNQNVNFIRLPSARALVLPGSDVQDKSLAFLTQQAKLYGIRSGMDLFSPQQSQKDLYGIEHISLQQLYAGVPIFDGVLRFHYDQGGALTSVNGNFIPGIKVNPKPTLSQQIVEERALKNIELPTGTQSPLKVRQSTLYIFQKGLLQGYPGAIHLVYEVEVTNDVNVREFVFVDAHTGEVVEQFTGIHGIHRELSENNRSNVIWKEGDPFPGSLNKWQQSEIESAGNIYNLMKNAFGYVSYDNKDAPMRTVNNDPQIACPNASWNGSTTNYCDGTAADDVVAHEWGHAYTQYTSGLIYAWQSGALNESYSDIWGETVDLLNGYMDEDENLSVRTSCGSSSRWQVGEKATAFGGALRDMWDPTCHGDPGKVSDPQYRCIPSDRGGVHANSGVLNHAYALLVDGGTYNGYTINGIGLTKAAHIFWRTQRVYLTRTSDFTVQANALEASANDLIGINLKALSTASNDPGFSGQTITSNDVEELGKVIKAVELRLANTDCDFTSLYKPVADNCDGSLPGKAFFYEDFESGMDGWTVATLDTNGTFTPRQWEVKSTSLVNRPGHAAFATDPNSGDCSTVSERGVLRLYSPTITIPANASGPFNLAFKHYIALEPDYDGGNIKYKIGDGSWTLVPSDAFLVNAYPSQLFTSAQDNTNPLQGQFAFTGGDRSSNSSGWIESRIDLTALGLAAGQTIQLRWDMGTDCGVGWYGWYIDDVSVYSCALPAVHFALAESQLNEAEATTPDNCRKYVEKTIEIVIDKAPSQPVTVTLQNPGGTATQGIDYTFSPTSVTLQAGQLSKQITVRMYSDGNVEGDETIQWRYTVHANGGDGFAGGTLQTHTLTIHDKEIDPENFGGTLYSANFNNSLENWTITNGGNSSPTWERVPYYTYSTGGTRYYQALYNTPFLFVNSNATRGDMMDEIVESPPFNTLGFSDLKLSFDQYFRVYRGSTDYDEQGITEIWDGNSWQTLDVQTETTGSKGSFGSPNTRTLTIPTAYANAAMKIRFRYLAKFDYYWAIDNVKVTGTPQIQTSVNTSAPDQKYLGPKATVYFYDPTSGRVVTKIKNLTDHDYGCTTVAVDRQGTDATPWFDTYKITNKTFKITPTTNNPSGEYEITLYYQSDELPSFNGDQIKSMGKSTGSIGNTNNASNSSTQKFASSAFYGHYAFKSRFQSGFSGFGMSDAPFEGALPVTLVEFQGKSIPEGNLLQWSTAKESQNDSFILERATKGQAFEAIARIQGVGNANTLQRYQYVDRKVSSGIQYYRLKQVDFNGASTYSKVISVDSRVLRNLVGSPNPVHAWLTIKLPDVKTEAVDLIVVNAVGQQVLHQQYTQLKEGTLQTDLSQLPPGVYRIILQDEVDRYTLSIIKY